ncbi:TetR family transcriptional regulator [Curtobacterium sp. BH-2-1-1]|nr:TetR family transcriptional regulator [Curtobacterium sp. BH-2-1-1]
MERSSGTIRNDFPFTQEEDSVRADARRNADALTDAAKAVFATDGVDAPAKLIADRAGVGVGTLYRRFPQRSDLVVAVFQRAVESTAAAADELAAAHAPDEALALWLQRFTEFVATKRGLAAALHSGDPAFEALPDYFLARLGGALGGLLDAAAAAGTIRPDVDAQQLLHAVADLCHGAPTIEQSQLLVGLLVDGLRYRATA